MTRPEPASDVVALLEQQLLHHRSQAARIQRAIEVLKEDA